MTREVERHRAQLVEQTTGAQVPAEHRTHHLEVRLVHPVAPQPLPPPQAAQVVEHHHHHPVAAAGHAPRVDRSWLVPVAAVLAVLVLAVGAAAIVLSIRAWETTNVAASQAAVAVDNAQAVRDAQAAAEQAAQAAVVAETRRIEAEQERQAAEREAAETRGANAALIFGAIVIGVVGIAVARARS